MVIGNLNANTANVKELLKAPRPRWRAAPVRMRDALQYAILTDRKKIPAKIKKTLSP